MKEYFGFVYRWHDSKRNMYYIGSHYGHTDDGYICSNERMMYAYTARPEDFTREILEYLYEDDIKELLRLEQKQFDLVENIKDHPQYYNKKNEAEGGWSHITQAEIEKRAQTLVERQKKEGLTEAERESYKQKAATRNERWQREGFSEAEQKQYNSYGCKVQVITPDGEELIFPSIAQAARETGVDIRYAIMVTARGRKYKGYDAIVLEEPKIDCRTFKE